MACGQTPETQVKIGRNFAEITGWGVRISAWMAALDNRCCRGNIMDKAPTVAVYRFEGFVLDIGRGSLLTAAGEELPLRRQSFEMLRLFAENAGRLLDRDTINRAIWSDVAVTDDSMTQCVRDIRRAIGDDAQRILKTVPRRGYLLSADVVVARDPPSGSAAPVLALPDKPSLVVLPFQNMSDDPDQVYFADGLVEDITTALSCIRSLFVIARNSAFAYRDRAVDVRQVGRDLGVRYALEGSVRRAGNRLRVTTQLIDTTSGVHVWAERYDRDLSDIFAVQDEIATSVAGVVEPALADAEQQRVLRKPPERLDAWGAYQRGLWHFYNHGSDENETARTFFHRAIALDPKFAPGHYGYALALQWEIWHYSTRPFSEVQAIPLEEALIAVSLDDKDAMGHAVLAHIRMWGSDWEAAIAEARKAVALNPNGSFGIGMLGCVLGFGGYREEALDRLRQAMRLSPQDPLTSLWILWIGLIQFFARQFTAAVESLRQVGRLRPYYNNFHAVMASALAFLGHLDEARDVLLRAPPLDPRYPQAPWMRPKDIALRMEGIRLAAGDS
ncbi:MAG: winged helix-turn-helix domain-containing protein [Caldimonas sp.]